MNDAMLERLLDMVSAAGEGGFTLVLIILAAGVVQDIVVGSLLAYLISRVYKAFMVDFQS